MMNYRFVANMNMNVDKGQLENLLCPPWLDWNLSMFGNNESRPSLVEIWADSSDNGDMVMTTHTLERRKLLNIDFELKKVLLPPPPPPLGNFTDISYLEENFKPHLLRDVYTLCSGALVSDSLLYMLL